MATKSAAIQVDDLQKAANGMYLDMWQIKAIAQMLNDHYEVNKAGFPDDVGGGILAILSLASQSCKAIEPKL